MGFSTQITGFSLGFLFDAGLRVFTLPDNRVFSRGPKKVGILRPKNNDRKMAVFTVFERVHRTRAHDVFSCFFRVFFGFFNVFGGSRGPYKSGSSQS